MQKGVGVFCAATDIADVYVAAAQACGQLLGKKGYDLVWGGSDKGLMNIIASAIQEQGGRLTGVIVEQFATSARHNADEMIVADSMAERKRLMLEKSDAFLILPGGIGTLDELAEVLEFKKQGMHSKPIVILNTQGFFNGLKEQFSAMQSAGCLPKPFEELVYFAENPESAAGYIEEHIYVAG